MIFKYTKTVEVDFSTIFEADDIKGFIVDMLTDNIDNEIWDEDEYEETFEAIKKEAYRYVAKELNKMVE